METKLGKEVNVNNDNSEMDLYIDCQDDDIMNEEEMQGCNCELNSEELLEYKRGSYELNSDRIDFREYFYGLYDDELDYYKISDKYNYQLEDEYLDCRVKCEEEKCVVRKMTEDEIKKYCK